MDKHNKWKIELYPLKNFNFNIDILGSQLFLLIKKDFIKIIKNYIPNKIIIKKKNKERIYENLFCHWYFWEAYTSKFNYHPLLLDKKFTNESLKNILRDYFKNESIDLTDDKFQEIINELNLQEKFTKSIILLKDIISYDCKYKIYYYDNFLKIFINTNLENDSFTISTKRSLDILKKLGEKKFVALMYRYHVLSSNNNQLATNSTKLKEINPDLELFSSGFNNTCNKFCSIFPDLEKDLGSIGRVQDINILEGIYQINPPFQTTIIYNIIKKIKNWIDIANKNDKYLEFHLFLPNWLKNNSDLEYSKYLVLDLINEINGNIKVINLKNNDFNYIDYWNNKIRNYTLPDTLNIIINNKNN